MFPLVQLCFQICELNNKTHLKYMNSSQDVEEKVNPYPSLFMLAIWAFCHKISSLLWKEDIEKLLDASKWSTLHQCPSPLHHMIQMPIFIFLTMDLFFSKM